MFCSKCGARLGDSARFCSKCGTQVPASFWPVEAKRGPSEGGSTPFARAMARLNGREGDALWAVAQAALVLVSFFPLLKLNLTFLVGEYSVPGLLTILDLIEGQVFMRLIEDSGAAGANSVANSVVIFVVLLVVLWGAGIVTAARTVVRVARGGDARPAAFTILSVLAFLFALLTFAMNGAFGDVAGYGLSPVLPTVWLWVLGVGAVVCNVCCRAVRR